MTIRFVKTVYDAPEVQDGCRLIIMRRYPRGISKSRVHAWMPQLAPTLPLVHWYHDNKNAVVWAGAKQGHSYAEVEMQGSEKFNETALFFHLTQIPSGICFPKSGYLFFEIFWIGLLPLSLDRIFVVMVPMSQR